ncbi:ThiF family adenylyltransferase [Mesobacillus selenatarsenatis]|uniref:Sulfur carrier protein adenylyltransferase ThiF n=1 Tax=Mesobacillus selenatarsenatis (strain DSM 18680 / JCM 14380 / FERM P-15431 / SF-1) TaxID=1321606 RepID=A0A0A8X4T0_MESS1|nr:ThiF family adenylyltransferase [Mesobacillus selenatarsenatis]GAM14274.1 sulfur carrier protein adenylyltransferase ThiF [Mesobacillus selenatarsenatis SF-1]
MEILNSLEQELEVLDQTLFHRYERIDDIDPKEFRGCRVAYDIEVTINGKQAKLRVGIPPRFPAELPDFYDIENLFGSIPHKESDGFFCYTRNESLILDERFPGSILVNCLEKVLKLIEDGINGINRIDFFKEFEVYWRRQKGCGTLFGNINTELNYVRQLDFWVVPVEEGLAMIAMEKEEGLTRVVESLFKVNIKDGHKVRCIYLPLEREPLLLPPLYGELWDFKMLKEVVLSNLSSDNWKRFRKITRKSIPGDVSVGGECVILGVPLPEGGHVLFGSLMTLPNKGKLRDRKGRQMPDLQIHPFVQKPAGIKNYPLSIKRWNKEHLIERTGGEASIIDKHVVIVGTGAVGGEITVRMAKAGVKKLTLIDNDTYSLENIHRHPLGSEHVYIKSKKGIEVKDKVHALMDELNRKYPFTSVEPIPKRWDRVEKEGNIDWETVDLVIVAIGSPNIEMGINRFLAYKNIPTIFTWVEPLGIGGHAIVSHNNNRNGCYQCLFKPEEGDPLMNRSAFAKPNQSFTKAITGCGSTFVPYSFLDSERTAILATEIAIKTLIGQEEDNPLLSWKGDQNLFIKNGFLTTRRFDFSAEELFDKRYLYKDPNCPVCSGGRKMS